MCNIDGTKSRCFHPRRTQLARSKRSKRLSGAPLNLVFAWRVGNESSTMLQLLLSSSYTYRMRPETWTGSSHCLDMMCVSLIGSSMESFLVLEIHPMGLKNYNAPSTVT